MGFVRGVLAVAVVGALAVGGWQWWKHTPPFERGFHTVEASSLPPEGGPRLGACPIFPADNVWNTPVDTLPVLPRNQAYIDGIGPMHKIHPDFGADMRYGIPFSEVPPGTAAVPVSFEYGDESDAGRYPIPPDAPIEGVSEGGSDRHILLIDPRTCVLYEIYHADHHSDGAWFAGSGARWDLTSNALRPDGKTSADAAGLPIFPGLVRYDEVAAGEIRHALRFTLPHTQAAYVWPARHKASPSTDPNLPPLGTRFRLRPDFDISHFSKSNQVILRALKRYGMFLADNGSPLYLSGVPDKRWNDSDLHELGAVKADDLQAVDESGLLVLPDSGRVNAPAR